MERKTVIVPSLPSSSALGGGSRTGGTSQLSGIVATHEAVLGLYGTAIQKATTEGTCSAGELLAQLEVLRGVKSRVIDLVSQLERAHGAVKNVAHDANSESPPVGGVKQDNKELPPVATATRCSPRPTGASNTKAYCARVAPSDSSRDRGSADWDTEFEDESVTSSRRSRDGRNPWMPSLRRLVSLSSSRPSDAAATVWPSVSTSDAPLRKRATGGTRILREEASRVQHTNELLFAAKCREIFNEIDTNETGTLDVEELTVAAEMLGRELSPDEIDRIFESDVSEERLMNVDEFVQLMATKEKERAERTAAQLQQQSRRIADLGDHMAQVTTSMRGSVGVFHPDNVYVWAWDMGLLAVLIAVFPLVPMLLAFEQLHGPLAPFEQACDILFVVDIFKNFNVGYVDGDGKLQMDRHMIARNYLKLWFWPDALSVVSILPASATKALGHGSVALDVLKTCKLFKLARAAHIVETLSPLWYEFQDYYRIHVSDAPIKLTRMFLVLATIAHFLGCFMYALARFYGFPEDSWVVIAGLVDVDGTHLMTVGRQYSWCMKRALALIVMEAYNAPYTRSVCQSTSGWCAIETWLTLACLYVGSIFYAALISNISAIVSDMNVSRRLFEERVTTTDEYLSSKHIPGHLRERVREYYHLRYANGRIFDEDSVLNSLNNELRTEILAHTTRPLVNCVPFLANSPERFTRGLTVRMRPSIFFARDLIVQEGGSSTDVYFVKTGMIEILLRACGNVAVHVVSNGCFFGEVAALLDCKRTASLRTLSITATYSVTGPQLLDALVDFPEVERYLREVGNSRHAWLDALATAFTEGRDLPPKDDKEDMQTQLYEQHHQHTFATLVQCSLNDSLDRGVPRKTLALRRRLSVHKASSDDATDGAVVAQDGAAKKLLGSSSFIRKQPRPTRNAICLPPNYAKAKELPTAAPRAQRVTIRREFREDGQL